MPLMFAADCMCKSATRPTDSTSFPRLSRFLLPQKQLLSGPVQFWTRAKKGPRPRNLTLGLVSPLAPNGRTGRTLWTAALDRRRGHSLGRSRAPTNMTTSAMATMATPTTSATAAGGGAVPGAQAGVPSNEDVGIREVWSHNLEEEFKRICQVVAKYPFVAMDTEFPGVVARPIGERKYLCFLYMHPRSVMKTLTIRFLLGEFRSNADYQYQLLRCNVDLLKIIQLGLTFLDEKGNMPPGITTWQFNFKFNLTEDMYAEDSVDLLQNSGIQFEKHEQEGINPNDFAEKMIVSGLVLMEPVKWVSFHSGQSLYFLTKHSCIYICLFQGMTLAIYSTS